MKCMPPKFKYSKEEIIEKAIDLIRENGQDFLSARNLSKALKASPKIIFGAFNGMDDLKKDIYKKVKENYNKMIWDSLNNTAKPAYLTTGLAYINFAKNDSNLFKLLFSNTEFAGCSAIGNKDETLDDIYKVIMDKSELTYHEAINVHFNYWIYLVGISGLITNNLLDVSNIDIERILEDNYRMLVNNEKEKRKENDGDIKAK